MLWFDVGIKRYTTYPKIVSEEDLLWFDVGIKRYTTGRKGCWSCCRCGLM